uniref:Uncharacterized protein n=1 Tax=Opuntia streptacantha TaxID=393608 RepID=A0A7C9AWC5_OPUST
MLGIRDWEQARKPRASVIICIYHCIWRCLDMGHHLVSGDVCKHSDNSRKNASVLNAQVRISIPDLTFIMIFLRGACIARGRHSEDVNLKSLAECGLGHWGITISIKQQITSTILYKSQSSSCRRSAHTWKDRPTNQ